MPARIIYLDQNKWIELARALSGKDGPELIQVLDILRESKRLGLNVFPLSLPTLLKRTSGETSKAEAVLDL
jgi:hypothetical protein